MARNRFTNTAPLEPKEASSPIHGYQHLLILTLEEAIQKIVQLVPGIVGYVSMAKENCNQNSTLITWNESATIYLYSMSIPFFFQLNTALRAKNRDELKPWFAFLKLFITALEKLPSTKATVWRGVNYDDTLTFVDNDMHIWWGVNSCSMNPRNVQPFLGEKGTLFVIDAIHGKDISTFSAFPDEQEIILMPGTRVRNKFESLSFIDRLFIVHLKEEDLRSESQTEPNYLFKLIKQKYQRHNRIEYIMNPAKSFPIEQSFINLAIVKAKEQHEKEKQLRDVQHNSALIGAFEEIYGMKTAIAIKDIFETCKNQENQVLVFGRAGIGKSTFCRYIAYKWAAGSYWSQYELLVLIPLRRLTSNRYPPLPSGQSYSLMDLVKKEVFEHDLSGKDGALLKKEFDVNKTLWILDGYDEIIQNVPQHLECLFEQLLKTPHHILTSRPYLNTLSYDVQMEITGFTDKNIVEYVEQFFDKMKDEIDDASIKSQTLLSFSRANPNIWGVAHIPVNLELICSLWSNEDWSETERLTMTTLYSMMTEWLCRRYLRTQDNQFLQLSKDEIDLRCQKELTFLGSLAFNAMEKNTLIIRPNLLKQALDEAKVSLKENPHILNIGILKSFHKQGIGTRFQLDKDHYFVHLSFQEYFAARHLIHALRGSPTEKVIEFIKHQKYNQRYALVFTFAAGLLSENDAKPCVYTFWNNILGEPLDLVGIRHMQLVISCIEEISDKSTIPQCTKLLEWIAECMEYSFSKENKTLREDLSHSLEKAPSVACDETIIKVLIKLLQNDDCETKIEVLLFLSSLKLSNPSTKLITSIILTLDDKNEKVRWEACLALGKIGEKAATNEVISKLMSALGNERENIRYYASVALGNIGEKAGTNEVINKLVNALEDEIEYVRVNAFEALGKIGEKAATNEVISKLVTALGDESGYVRCNACKTLGKIGEKAATNNVINQLVTALGDESEYVRANACEALGIISGNAAMNEVISKLISALGSESGYVRANACLVLGNIGEKATTTEMISELMSALGDEMEYVRQYAFKAFATIGEKAATNEVMSKLVSALGDKSIYIRQYACETLGKIGEKAATNEVIDKLVNALADESIYVRQYACETLGKIGEKAATTEVIGELVNALDDERVYVRQYACQAFAKIGENAATNKVISKLVNAIGDESLYVRQHACETIGKIGEKAATNEVISKLVNALADESIYVRHYACETLGNLGEKAATNAVISELVSALGSESEPVRGNACKALGKMGEKAATNAVINKLVSAVGDQCEFVRAKACEALGRMGKKSATNEVISNLVSVLGDEDIYVRANACKALGRMGEKGVTNEVISKLVVLMNSDSHVVFSDAAKSAKNSLVSSAVMMQLDPKIITDLCLCKHGSNCLENVSEDQLINIFFTTKNPDWLSAFCHFTLLKRVAVTFTQDKVVIYGRKEPLELVIPSLELQEQLIETLTQQAKRLHVSF